MIRARASAFLAAGVLVLADAQGASDPPQHIVACSAVTCTATFDPAHDEAEFAWVWTDDTAPTRIPIGQLKLFSYRTSDHRLTIQVAGRTDTASPLTLIAAPVQMWTEVPEPMLPRFPVPKSGLVSVPSLRSIPWRVRLAGDGRGTWWSTIGPSQTKVTLTHSPASTRSLRIIDAASHPVADAGVTLAASSSGAHERKVMAQLRSGRDGGVMIDALPDREVTLIVSARDRAPVAFTTTVATLPESIVLQAGMSITGRFIDSEKLPLAGVSVRAEGWLGDSGAVIARKTVSSAEGKWTLGQLPPGSRMVLAAERLGLVPLRKEMAVSRSVDLGNVVLRKGQTISLIVIDDADRRALAGARINAGLGRSAMTNAKGLALLRDVALDDSLEITSKAAGYLSKEQVLMPPFGREVSVELTRAFTVKGRFATSAGAPVAGTTVRVVNGKSFRDVPLVDSDFNLALEPEQSIELDFLSPTTRALRLDVSGKRGEVRDLGELRAPEGTVVRGQVIDESGMPVGGASIWTPRISATGAVVAWATGNVIRTESDALGAFSLQGLGNDPLLLRVDAAGYARAFVALTPEAANDIDAGDITVKRGTTLRVVSLKGSEGVARIALRRESGDIDAISAPLRNGVAALPHIPPGRATLSVIRGRSTTCEKDVEVPAQSDPFEVDCTSGLVRVRGKVLVGKSPAGGGTLVWSSPHNPQTEGVIMGQKSVLGAQRQQVYGALSEVTMGISGTGDFESDQLRAGAWSVRWISPDRGSTTPRDVIIAEQQETTVVIQYPDAVIRGVVVDADEHPARRASVREIDGAGFAVTGDDGTFSIAGMLPGPHRLQAIRADLVSAIAEIRLEAGREAPPLRLVLESQKANELSIKAFSADYQPASNAFIFLETSDGLMRIATTDALGQAKISFSQEPPRLVRCALAYNGSWCLGEWKERREWRDGLTLQLHETGAVLVSSDVASGTISIDGPEAWNMSSLMMRLGTTPFLSANAPLKLTGLPVGRYALNVGGIRGEVSVRAGETASIRLRK